MDLLCMCMSSVVSLVTFFRKGRAQRYLSLALHPRSHGHGGIQGVKCTGESVGR